MHPTYRILGRRRRQRVRELARQAYLHSPPSEAVHNAEVAVRREMQGFISLVLVGIAVRLAIELIMYWLNLRMSEPGLTFQPGEPGAEG